MRPRAVECLGLLLLVLVMPSVARATPPSRSGGASAHGTAPRHQGTGAAGRRGGGGESEPGEVPQLTSPAEVSAGTAASNLGASGQVDPLTGLGIRSPLCDATGEIRDRTTRLACEASGVPEANYPASNYGFDTFITTGVTHPVGDITYAFATVLDGIWLGLLFVLRLVLSLLDLAFGLNPFSDAAAMSRISAALARLYARITDPWLSTLVVCAGVWLAWKGLVRREAAASVASTLAAVAMLIAGLWVVHQPGESVGRLAALSDEFALEAIAAPQSGSLSRPAGTYAEAMARTWAGLVEVPFAGLDFSEVGWALGPPPREAVEKADEKFCDDVGALALLATLAHYGSEEAKKACAAFARKRYGRPRRIVDLYLRSSPGSPARKALWDYFSGDDRYKAKVAAQGGDGALTRLSMLALFAIGLLGAILLLAWLAIRLFTQAAIAFVLLLAAPFALFFPLLGDSGRRAFRTWGLALLGAIAAKAVYAAFLSVVLLGIAILGSLGGNAGSATGFLLSAAFAWAVFLKRVQLVGWLSIGDADGQASHGLAPTFAALALARRTSRGTRRVLGATTGAGAGWAARRGSEHLAASRAGARGQLAEHARALADSRYREARRTVAEFEPSASAPASAAAGARSGDAAARSPGPPAVAPAVPAEHRERYRRARQLVEHVEHNRRTLGERFSERDLARFAAEDRALLSSSRDPADHAHRAGYGRAELESLRGPEREAALEKIEKATERDRERLWASSELPGRLTAAHRALIERARQHEPGESGLRREHLRRLRRDPRATAPGSRRNLSRGG